MAATLWSGRAPPIRRARAAAYLALAKGKASVNGVELGSRDGAAIRDESELHRRHRGLEIVSSTHHEVEWPINFSSPCEYLAAPAGLLISGSFRRETFKFTNRLQFCALVQEQGF